MGQAHFVALGASMQCRNSEWGADRKGAERVGKCWRERGRGGPGGFLMMSLGRARGEQGLSKGGQ